jgi:hypothetical protein
MDATSELHKLAEKKLGKLTAAEKKLFRATAKGEIADYSPEARSPSTRPTLPGGASAVSCAQIASYGSELMQRSSAALCGGGLLLFWLWLETACGWVLTTLILVGLAGLVRT